MTSATWYLIPPMHSRRLSPAEELLPRGPVARALFPVANRSGRCGTGHSASRRVFAADAGLLDFRKPVQLTDFNDSAFTPRCLRMAAC